MLSLPTVLIFDDEPRSNETLARFLEDDFDVHCATTVAQARTILQREWVQIILCDQRMPEISGVEFLVEVREQWPDVIRMIISGYTDPVDLIGAVNQAGIYHFINKPWQPDDLLLKLKNAAQLFDLQRQNEQLGIELKLRPETLEDELEGKRALLMARYEWDQSIVRAPESKMNQVCEIIQHVAPYDVNVVLTGESGTGKELCARALHYNSLRQGAPFVAENCGALPDELLESELFGYKRGAFTGAVEDRIGLFERANGGTIFLDEIGEISSAFQVKLLRVLQEGEIRPLGSSQRRKIDVRVVAATNRDLELEVQERRFRMDLYYRLATFVVHLPALRERPCDIAPIAYSILEDVKIKMGKRVKGFTKEALNCMQAYHWPGNVRELQNEIKRMLVMSHDDYLGAELLSARIVVAGSGSGLGDTQSELDQLAGIDGSLKERVETLETRILKETLIRHRWNKTRAAEELGLSRVGLRNKLERYDLEKA
jgi:two-component system, NtrC family, response regulator HupR/HoxA